ncbi:unnamed protein product [Trichogramma brassicae]|uniref:Uncharacterized protein n=1 Tax=Trichogramma brassicae TaxID=86971 RepID=A0A6H5IU07_9HYME|nr:unnamed protein product [Trichogramma brassicae]
MHVFENDLIYKLQRKSIKCTCSFFVVLSVSFIAILFISSKTDQQLLKNIFKKYSGLTIHVIHFLDYYVVCVLVLRVSSLSLPAQTTTTAKTPELKKVAAAAAPATQQQQGQQPPAATKSNGNANSESNDSEPFYTTKRNANVYVEFPSTQSPLLVLNAEKETVASATIAPKQRAGVAAAAAGTKQQQQQQQQVIATTPKPQRSSSEVPLYRLNSPNGQACVLLQVDALITIKYKDKLGEEQRTEASAIQVQEQRLRGRVLVHIAERPGESRRDGARCGGLDPRRRRSAHHHGLRRLEAFQSQKSQLRQYGLDAAGAPLHPDCKDSKQTRLYTDVLRVQAPKTARGGREMYNRANHQEHMTYTTTLLPLPAWTRRIVDAKSQLIAIRLYVRGRGSELFSEFPNALVLYIDVKIPGNKGTYV